ncbi:ArsR/SmtB family transcription factor [Allorhodopirellula heiligendammensis]|uniref:HTH-type transcriptional regulator n=1 Tax=Allorhodopirellula heiligendammensis TaxID=2714739 RepID=A0A5C6C8N3_9BACT|nr:metalloregulator ArsR/SmtB family transcription factor [Allorhodopirellula heiligendammensis]TWU19756.1 HTH-type transcriptional regulator [Allorhodopirellula heiligendammensis]
MSTKPPQRPSRLDLHRSATTFAALGDETRLKLLTKLSRRSPQSIKELSMDLPVTRQAVTKHLRILESANFVFQETHGRERRFAAVPDGMDEAHTALNFIAQQWDDALQRLKSFAEQ